MAEKQICQSLRQQLWLRQWIITRLSHQGYFSQLHYPLGEDGYFAELIKLRSSGKVNTEGIRLVSGDEYHGIPQSNPGSFCTYLTNKVINPLGMSAEKSLQLNGGFIGDPDKADEECRVFENNLRLDPCELAVLGLGTNGHVAFNDPPSDLCTKTRRLKLTEGSIKSSESDFPTFSPEELPTEALSVGLSTLKECCKLCIVLVVGARKQEIVKQCLRSDELISPSVPASQLRYARNFMFLWIAMLLNYCLRKRSMHPD